MEDDWNGRNGGAAKRKRHGPLYFVLVPTSGERKRNNDITESSFGRRNSEAPKTQAEIIFFSLCGHNNHNHTSCLSSAKCVLRAISSLLCQCAPLSAGRRNRRERLIPLPALCPHTPLPVTCLRRRRISPATANAITIKINKAERNYSNKNTESDARNAPKINVNR